MRSFYSNHNTPTKSSTKSMQIGASSSSGGNSSPNKGFPYTLISPRKVDYSEAFQNIEKSHFNPEVHPDDNENNNIQLINFSKTCFPSKKESLSNLPSSVMSLPSKLSLPNIKTPILFDSQILANSTVEPPSRISLTTTTSKVRNNTSEVVNQSPSPLQQSSQSQSAKFLSIKPIEKTTQKNGEDKKSHIMKSLRNVLCSTNYTKKDSHTSYEINGRRRKHKRLKISANEDFNSIVYTLSIQKLSSVVSARSKVI